MAIKVCITISQQILDSLPSITNDNCTNAINDINDNCDTNNRDNTDGIGKC